MKTKILFLIALLFILVSSCDRCPLGGNTYESYKLTETEKQLISYKLGQIVSFLDSEGNIFDMVVIEDTISWEDNFYENDPCTGYLYSNENYRATSLSSDYMSFNINLYVNAMQERLRIKISSLEDFFFLRYSERKGFVTDKNYAQYFHSSIKINNQTYYDVVEKDEYYYEIDENGHYIRPACTMSILYNEAQGILQIKDKGTAILTINR